MKKWLFCLCFFSGIIAYSQNQTTRISFVAQWDGKIVSLEKNYSLNTLGDSLKFETLKFYITDFQIFKDSILVHSLAKKHILIDFEKPESLVLTSGFAGSFNKIKFTLGIDSATNYLGAMEGDLDPIYNMYWTWQSGYVNFKMEGKSTACPARKNRFQWHLGGYMGAFNSVQSIELGVEQKAQLNLVLDLNKIFNEKDLMKNYQIMTPSLKAKIMAQKVASSFTFVHD